MLDELLQHGKAIQPRHLDIQKDDIRLVLADQLDGFDPVRAFSQHIHAAGGVQQILQLIASKLLVIDDQRGNRRRSHELSIARSTVRSGGRQGRAKVRNSSILRALRPPVKTPEELSVKSGTKARK